MKYDLQIQELKRLHDAKLHEIARLHLARAKLRVTIKYMERNRPMVSSTAPLSASDHQSPRAGT